MDNEEAVEGYIKLRPIYSMLSNKVTQIIREVLELNNINYHIITYRAKTIESFSDKIGKPKYDDPLNQITDLAGIRIISFVQDDVAQVERIIKDLFIIDLENSINKTKTLGIDRVGYKSIHYVCQLPQNRTELPEYTKFAKLKFEIQIRTILEHSWAEIDHDKCYKFSGEIPVEIQRRFKLLAATLESADNEFNLLSRKIENYSEEVKKNIINDELNISINSTSLKNYIQYRFRNLIEKGKIIPEYGIPQNVSIILEELNNFGVNKIADFANLVPENFENVISNSSQFKTNLVGVCRIFMIASDPEKYLSKSYKDTWIKWPKSWMPINKKLNLNKHLIMESILKKNR